MFKTKLLRCCDNNFNSFGPTKNLDSSKLCLVDLCKRFLCSLLLIHNFTFIDSLLSDKTKLEKQEMANF